MHRSVLLCLLTVSLIPRLEDTRSGQASQSGPEFAKAALADPGNYLNMTVRGEPTAPARSALGQRSLEKPMVLVTNQHPLSDAEDFTEGYRAMKPGKVVGEPTSGWIIYTWNTRLIASGWNLQRSGFQSRLFFTGGPGVQE